MNVLHRPTWTKDQRGSDRSCTRYAAGKFYFSMNGTANSARYGDGMYSTWDRAEWRAGRGYGPWGVNDRDVNGSGRGIHNNEHH